MNPSTARVLFLSATLLTWSAVNAQRPGPGAIPDPSVGDGPRAHEFWPAAPQVGDLFPDVSVVDDQGVPVNIRELAAENYSVLVLGCLT